jgi:hypothetical protein
MKLNFWQILGILLILAYLVLWMTGVVGSDKDPGTPIPTTTSPAATTAPAQ